MHEPAAAPASPDFRALFEAVPEYCLALDTAFTIIAASNAFVREALTPREALLGVSVFEALPGLLDAEDLRASWLRVQASGESETLPVRKFRISKSGEERYWQLTNSPVRIGDGPPTCLILGFEDVTELVELKQREADACEAMQRSTDEAQRFAYLAAHDLQSPLNAISGCVRLLREEMEGKLSDQGERFMGYVLDYTLRAQTLIQDLLTYSRLETRARPFEPTDLNRVFSDALHMLANPIANRGAVVSSGDLPTLPADRTQMTMLISNLIDNAIKFNRAERPDVRVEAQLTGDEWLVSVTDNGIGIEPRFHEEVFEIFRRLHSAEAYPGSGVGLAICRRVVCRHGGRIWVESQEGKGSTFRFTLPGARKGLIRE